MYLDQSMVLEYRPHMELGFLVQTLMDALSSLHDKDKFHNCCRRFFLNSKLHHHSCKVQYWVHRYILNLCHFSSNSKMDIPLHILFDIWFMHYSKSSVINRSCAHIPTQPNFFWSFSNWYSNLLWSFWVVSRRKIKIWIRGKKVQFITESCVFKAETPANFPF